ncbi:uncharacterized protein DUF4192 [Prauserella shujinwangii]|uniref:Uncharacterized protein DUF4192 n=1 Tax=Prauserella shujinwangii TaxID=1453103 RepID=A0A2T0LS57_9PSEU|nr:DUF4192 domain-containing protein [Prauserella shujinwangii]PRX46453.1 uncharacterized protein DUF4192 [Prauserella shujinwangii]
MTASTSAGTTTVSLRDPGQLLAALPHLLGFRPADSVLVVAHGGRSGRRVGNVVRADLPRPDGVADLAQVLRASILAGDVAAATVAVVGGGKARGRAGPPWRDLVDAVAEAFAHAGHHVAHSLWVPEISAGARWHCYHDPACTGRMPDPASSVMAAVAAHQGMVTYPSREEMERQLAPADPAALARRSALLDAELEVLGARSSPEQAREQGLARVRAALGKALAGQLTFTDEEVAGLALALSVPEVRDACLATAVPTGESRALAAERLWLALVRETPAPERAQAACLLAYSAYVRGEGALAGMALENALTAHPGHVLAGLLHQALRHAVPPSRITGLGERGGEPSLWEPG